MECFDSNFGIEFRCYLDWQVLGVSGGTVSELVADVDLR